VSAYVCFEDRVRGGLYGLLVGDAVGVPYESQPRDAMPPREAIDMVPPPDFARSHPDVPPGTWSDDGAQALCLLSSLLDASSDGEGVDVDDLAKRLRAWLREGYHTVDGRAFGIGSQTSRAIRALEAGVAPDKAGPATEAENGNGSLMRVLPLPLWHRGSDAALVRDAVDQSRPTHGHVRSLVCCAVYCLWARRELESDDDHDTFADAVATFRDIAKREPSWLDVLDQHVRPHEAPTGAGTPYVVDTLRSALMLLRTETSYEGVVRGAIALGRDTDTTACVAGGIAGIRYGFDGIPARWVEALRGREVVEPLARRLRYERPMP
jgi:ADP-ribosyl-[dinitrogen reductase] hydrolase